MDIVDDLRQRVAQRGPGKVAEELGVDRSYVWYVLKRKRNPGAKLIKAMGYATTHVRLPHTI